MLNGCHCFFVISEAPANSFVVLSSEILPQSSCDEHLLGFSKRAFANAVMISSWLAVGGLGLRRLNVSGCTVTKQVC